MPVFIYDSTATFSTGTSCTSPTPNPWWVTTATTSSTTTYNAQQYFALAQQRGAYQAALLAQQQASQQQIVAQQAVAQQRIMEARQRSRELLLEHLTDAQRETFEKNQWFVVQGGKSKKEYRIRTSSGYTGNIDEMRSDKVVARWCFHASYEIPEYDHYLSQKIALELDEERFLKIANRRMAA